MSQKHVCTFSFWFVTEGHAFKKSLGMEQHLSTGRLPFRDLEQQQLPSFPLMRKCWVLSKLLTWHCPDGCSASQVMICGGQWIDLGLQV